MGPVESNPESVFLRFMLTGQPLDDGRMTASDGHEIGVTCPNDRSAVAFPPNFSSPARLGESSLANTFGTLTRNSALLAWPRRTLRCLGYQLDLARVTP